MFFGKPERIVMRKIIILLLLFSLLSSCHRQSSLFKYHPDTASNDRLQEQFMIPVEPLLSVGDKITMSIWGHNELSIGTVNSIYTSNEETGKWLIIDNEGKVNLPKIGRVRVSGMTVKESNYFLEQQYSRILNEPIINVRVLNHFVTVLGEVNKPGRYSLDNEKVSLIEILGVAKGLTDYSKNEEVEVVRIIEGQPVKLTVNLVDLANLPRKNIVLQPEDIVYIGATKSKNNDRNLGKATLITSIITGIAVIFSVFSK